MSLKETSFLEKSFGWVSTCISNLRQFCNLPDGNVCKYEAYGSILESH